MCVALKSIAFKCCNNEESVYLLHINKYNDCLRITNAWVLRSNIVCQLGKLLRLEVDLLSKIKVYSLLKYSV